MKSKTLDIEAEIEVLPFEEIGRTIGNHMKIDIYYPIFKFENQLNDVFLSHKTKEFLKSEDKTEIGINFKFPCLQIGRLSVNDKFELTEGSRAFITGRITKIFKTIMDKSSWESNLSKSIEELENDVWNNQESYETTLIENCYILRKEQISNLTNEQLRLSINQEVGIQYTIPIAIQKLIQNKFIECDFYPGDLLQVVFRKLKVNWNESEFLKNDFTAMIRHRFSEIKTNSEMPEKIKREIFDNLTNYINTRDNKR